MPRPTCDWGKPFKMSGLYVIYSQISCQNHISVVMVCVMSSVVDCGFKPQSGETKDY